MSKPKLQSAVPQLPTGDINETASFFAERLGSEVVAEFPDHGHLTLARGNAEIQFWQPPTKEQARHLGQQSSCYVRVKHIRKLFDEFKRNDVPFRFELQEQPWGMTEMQIDDPYGNAIRFGEET